MIGKYLTDKLVTFGYTVRALSRREDYIDPRVDIYRGGLSDLDILRQFLKNADALFHCAAELHNESRMWEVNVNGTETLLRIAETSKVKRMCYLSSAGVVGYCETKWVDENTVCNPQNTYEKSKLEAEKLVAQGIKNCSIVILRPTNVVDDTKPGALSYPIYRSLMDRIKLFIKGGECANIVHALDVANAAIFLMEKEYYKPECFFVGCDEEPLNTFAGLWMLYMGNKNGYKIVNTPQPMHLPVAISHLLRYILRGKRNQGDIRYSSAKLLNFGFNYSLGIMGTVERMISFYEDN